MKTRNEALTRAYEALCQELNIALYEEDPASMGSSVGAPRDEYAAEAARLAATIKSSGSPDEVESHLREMFAATSDALVQRVEQALAKFRMQSREAMQMDKG